MKFCRINFIVSFIAVGMICFFGFVGYKFYNQQQHMHMNVIELSSKVKELEMLRCQSVGDKPQIIQGITPAQLWGSLQQRLQNTVVQIFVQKEDFNWIEPYKSPQEGVSLGSGFFISDKGEIITNAHVVNQGVAIHVQIPSFGKHQFEAELVGIMPEKDFSLIKIKPDGLALIMSSLGKFPHLSLGDSDLIHRADEVMAIGYPLGQQSLKSTTGVISGRESGMIQISAPINPGSSGGPAVNLQGEVIGINTAGITSAQNVGYIIPINDVKVFLEELRVGKLIRKPYLGILQSPATKELVQCLGNPEPGGVYVVEVQSDSPLKDKLQSGDMIYAVNGVAVDMYGEMQVPWSEDKVKTAEYVARLVPGQKVSFTIYRKGQKKVFTCNFDRKKLAPIRVVYPGYESVDFENFGGFVVMQLTLNHLQFLMSHAPGLAKFAEDKNQNEPVLVITHIMPNSPAQRCRLPIAGSIISKVNEKKVSTLQALRKAIAQSDSILKIETTDNIVVALSLKDILANEGRLARTHAYEICPGVQALLEKEVAQTTSGQKELS